MNSEEIKKLKEDHYEKYILAVLDTIKNNSYSLVNEDINSIIKKPPLEAMDVLKNKIISISKKNNFILDSVKLDNLLEKFRKEMFSIFNNFENNRYLELEKRILKQKDVVNLSLVKLLKKDFIDINKKIKKEIKEKLNIIIELFIENILNNLFNDINDSYKSKVEKEFVKYLKKDFTKQFLEYIDIKILIKDSILINNINDHSDRFLFTLTNSRLFN